MATLTKSTQTYNNASIECAQFNIDKQTVYRLSGCFGTESEMDGDYAFQMVARSNANRSITVTVGDKSTTFSTTSTFQKLSNIFYDVSVGDSPFVDITFPAGTYWLYHVQLEAGNTVTDWHPHEDDTVDEAIARADENVNIKTWVTNYDTRLTEDERSITLLAEKSVTTEDFAELKEYTYSEFKVQAGEISSVSSSLTKLDDKIEQNVSKINQTTDNITLEVSKKVGDDEIISKINQSAETISISASKINLAGAVTISSLDSNAQKSLVSSVSTKNQYYLSTSVTEATGGSWSDSTPTWSSGKYVWIRTATTKTYASGTSETTHSTAIYDKTLTTALSTANTANTTANTANTTANSALSKGNSAVTATVSCYYRSTTSTTPTINTSTSIGTAQDTSNAWEYVLPRPKKNCYFFTCERYTKGDGTVSFSTVRSLSNVTYTSLWCSANDATYIDGGNIYANTVTANQLASNSVTAAKIQAGAVTADKISVTDLSALNAKIGGWTIDTNSIYTTSNTTGKFTMLADGTNSNGDILVVRTGTNANTYQYPFYVRNNGLVHASNMEITGGKIEINSDDGAAGFITLNSSQEAVGFIQLNSSYTPTGSSTTHTTYTKITPQSMNLYDKYSSASKSREFLTIADTAGVRSTSRYYSITVENSADAYLNYNTGLQFDITSLNRNTYTIISRRRSIYNRDIIMYGKTTDEYDLIDNVTLRINGDSGNIYAKGGIECKEQITCSTMVGSLVEANYYSSSSTSETGFRTYNGGTRTFFVNAQTGDATFAGTIWVPQIVMHLSTGDETLYGYVGRMISAPKLSSRTTATVTISNGTVTATYFKYGKLVIADFVIVTTASGLLNSSASNLPKCANGAKLALGSGTSGAVGYGVIGSSGQLQLRVSAAATYVGNITYITSDSGSNY